jgi:fatty-acyl-CoA synthase
MVGAAVHRAAGAAIAAEAVSAHVRSRLAAHKVPRQVLLVESIGRGPNGKADYPQVRRRVQDWLAAQERS